MNIGQVVAGFTPEVQIILIVCAFAVVLVILMIVFLIIADRRKLQNVADGAEMATRTVTRLRKPKPQKNAPDE